MDHAQIDKRSLAFGRLIAQKLRCNPALSNLAMSNIDRWLQSSSARTVSTLLEWKELLKSVDRTLEALTSTDQEAVRMRQSNPFAGALTSSERNEIIRRFATHDASTT